MMTDDQVEAAVRDGGLQTVEVNLSSLDAPRLRCSCSEWERWGPCKHLWATLVEADRNGLAVLQPDAPPDAGKVSEEPPADWEGRLDALEETLRRVETPPHEERAALRVSVAGRI